MAWMAHRHPPPQSMSELLPALTRSKPPLLTPAELLPTWMSAMLAVSELVPMLTTPKPPGEPPAALFSARTPFMLMVSELLQPEEFEQLARFYLDSDDKSGAAAVRVTTMLRCRREDTSQGVGARIQVRA
mgnify:CR=1 FL=1